MRRSALSSVVAALLLAGCGGGGGGGSLTAPTGANACSVEGQKQFVLDQMRDIYFWNASLPANVDLTAFATPEALLAHLTSFQPLDSFSFINSAAADQQFFGEGRFAGFGFGYTVNGAGEARFLYVYAGSPAATAGFARGFEILAVDGQSVASLGASGLAASFGPAEVGVTRNFTIRRLDGSEFSADVSKDIVTIDPVPGARVIDTAGGPVGYLELATFISTAEAELATAFADFESRGVTDLVLDLRYNGGGLVRIAELLGDYLGGSIAEGDVFSKTLYNADNSDRNSTENFARLGASLALSRLVVIASGRTASASELVINGLEPHADVVIVGATTFGKPVGQVGIEFCEKILRPTAFEKVNALDNGGFFDGLPVDCPAEDDLTSATGSDDDPALRAGLAYFATGSCPAQASIAKPGPAGVGRSPLGNTPWERYAGAH